MSKYGKFMYIISMDLILALRILKKWQAYFPLKYLVECTVITLQQVEE